MTTYSFGDILLLSAFPYSDSVGVKKRPGLVVADIGDDDVLVARVTSENPHNSHDLTLERWKDFGLLLPSCVRLSKIATLSKGLVVKKLGKLGSPERKKSRNILKKLLES